MMQIDADTRHNREFAAYKEQETYKILSNSHLNEGAYIKHHCKKLTVMFIH